MLASYFFKISEKCQHFIEMVQSQRLQRQKVTLSDGLRLFIFFANENSEGEMSRPIKFTLMDGGMSEVLLSAKCF